MRSTVIWGTVLLTGLGCALSNRGTVPSSRADACGQLMLWNLPEGLLIERHPEDERTHALLLTQGSLNGLARAAEAYCAGAGRYPESIRELLSHRVLAAPQCMATDADARDGWGQPIYYSFSDARPLATSAGPDALFTTDDDVSFATAKDSSRARRLDLAHECS